MLVGEPVVAALLGVAVLGEHLAVKGSAAPGLLAAVVAMVASAIALGRGQAPVKDHASRPRDRAAPDPDATEMADVC
jgi:hypothetical protein